MLSQSTVVLQRSHVSEGLLEGPTDPETAAEVADRLVVNWYQERLMTKLWYKRLKRLH